METEFKDSFLKDIRSIKNKKILSRLEQFVLIVERVDNLSQLPNLKKLKGQKNKVYYRSRIGNYRVGLIIKQDIVVFVRFLNRKEIYRYFP
ncbi:MAG: type II toxin-antitoxin system RelE/ParE family toxin [Pleurocapsa sp. SU_5_0]|nr:type II toxin-antitoxin system RelE/ParE family toxin [Pleurocapsa sp. SU_5_0]NJO95966.1 type II toxin-antitoxin system RelE/ParE family toxin [Pleurocapsa sp. CRU_1_2]NJR46237.1 type II toxin-antitoxin system RelE/ParE family toxin [Hyellaceae cyanobacterium CSU_1_1]